MSNRIGQKYFLTSETNNYRHKHHFELVLAESGVIPEYVMQNDSTKYKNRSSKIHHYTDSIKTQESIAETFGALRCQTNILNHLAVKDIEDAAARMIQRRFRRR